MLDQVYYTNVKNLFGSVVILFLRFGELYKLLSKAFTGCTRSTSFPGKI